MAPWQRAEFDKQLDSCKSQIRAIQETYTTRATHEKDIDECRKKISKISEVYLTKEDFLPRAAEKPSGSSNSRTRSLTACWRF